MQISSRFTMALQIFTCMDVFAGQVKLTSEFLAESINTNPVVVRQLLGQLKQAGLITVARGPGGAAPARPLSEISFYDVYAAVSSPEQGELFHFHAHPNPACPVGRNIHALLDEKLAAIQEAMEAELRRYRLSELHEQLRERLAAEGEKEEKP